MAGGNTTANTQALARRDVYSQIILDELTEGFLPDGMHRDVSDFPDGSKLFIPTFGEVVVQDVMENRATPIHPIDTGRIELEITNHEGAGVYITDENREDAYYMSQFDAAVPGKMLHAVKESYETSLLATANQQTADDPNAINKWAHRWIARGAAGQITLEDFAYAKTSMLKAKVPDMGLIAIVDPIAEMTINTLTNIVNVSNNPRFEGLVETGFGKNMTFLKNIYGIDVYMSNRLPRIATETIDTTVNGGVGTGAALTTLADAVACQFLCVADDMVTPYMGAWRRKPDVEYVRDGKLRRDEYYLTARYGFGLQRPQALGVVLISDSNY